MNKTFKTTGILLGTCAFLGAANIALNSTIALESAAVMGMAFTKFAATTALGVSNIAAATSLAPIILPCVGLALTMAAISMYISNNTLSRVAVESGENSKLGAVFAVAATLPLAILGASTAAPVSIAATAIVLGGTALSVASTAKAGACDFMEKHRGGFNGLMLLFPVLLIMSALGSVAGGDCQRAF